MVFSGLYKYVSIYIVVVVVVAVVVVVVVEVIIIIIIIIIIYHLNVLPWDFISYDAFLKSTRNLFHNIEAATKNTLAIENKRKLDRALSGFLLGRHDQTAQTSGRGKKQRWSGCT